MSFVTVKKGELLSRSIEDYPEGLVIPVDKPYRWTSADVIRKIKWAAIKHFGKRNLKVGHAGTLDPLATGVLLICIGKATKLADEFQKQPKQYIAGVTFGATTASYDLEKEVDARFPLDGVSRESLLAVLPSFIGEQEQVARRPPRQQNQYLRSGVAELQPVGGAHLRPGSRLRRSSLPSAMCPSL